MPYIKKDDKPFRVVAVLGTVVLTATLFMLLFAACTAVEDSDYDHRGGEGVENAINNGHQTDEDLLEEKANRTGEVDAVEDHNVNGKAIEITDFKIEPERTHLHLLLNQVPGFRVFPEYEDTDKPSVLRERLDRQTKEIYMIDGLGREYHYQGGNFVAEHFYCSGCASGLSWFSQIYLEYPPLKDGVTDLKLVLPLSDGRQLVVDIPAEFLGLNYE